MRETKRLKHDKIAAMTASGMHSDGNGLYLLIGPSGTKSWIYRYRVGKKLHDLGLGPVRLVTLAEARRKALACSAARLDGKDPLAEKRAQRRAEAAVITFRQAGEAYLDKNRAGWRNAQHKWQWEQTLAAHAYPVIGDLAVDKITTADVLRVLSPIWSEMPETASRLRGRIETILDAEKALGHRSGENPAAWKGNLANLLPAPSKAKQAKRRETGKAAHHAALPYAELPEFMATLRAQGGTAARALEFAILTAARTSEIIGMTWAEIDVEARLWVVPADRMKAGKEHRVPLSDAALSALGRIKDRDPVRVFPISNMAMLMLLRRMKRPDLTVHGFRSTFSDWCAERTDTAPEVREMALAHAVDNKTEAAYRRGDLFAKRRDLAEAWALYTQG